MSNRRFVGGRGGRRAVLLEQSWEWQEAAACRAEPSELFFGPEGEKPPDRDDRERRALEVCDRCPVRDQCRSHAVRLPEAYGVWGGTSETDRQPGRRARMASPAA